MTMTTLALQPTSSCFNHLTTCEHVTSVSDKAGEFTVLENVCYQFVFKVHGKPILYS
ncbi:hypothetical protein HanIR_Chr17g0898161 [Helianthus annuus]|nr:hypothetical protein HanIR_Chr17g0898161 [Helianthus annuus]